MSVGLHCFKEVKMLKLTASYSKKVPAEAEYSSQSYHCCVEVEIAEGLSKDQLDAKIHETFALVRDSVEAELHGAPVAPATTNNVPDVPASPKQLKFLCDLLRSSGVTPNRIKTRFNVGRLEELTRSQCSGIIDELSGKVA